MASLDDPGDSLASGQMNAELRHAQLEMLSAQCATDRLRLRYSAEDLARHAQRDILRKAWSSANALFEYYNAIVNKIPDRHTLDKSSAMTIEEAKVLDASDRMARYLYEQRGHFRLIGQPLEKNQQDAMAPFFSAQLLAMARIVVLDRQRIPKPPLDPEAKAMGIAGLPDFPHPSSATFGDVLVFYDEITSRHLFHALVHAVQLEVLGLEAYAERFVRGFLRTRTHATVPLEVHAAMLETAFAEHAQPFSVEEKVRLWMNQGRY
jgi:hypothetical protein